MWAMRRSTPLALAVLLALTGCAAADTPAAAPSSPATTAPTSSPTPTPTDDAPTALADVHESLGCTEPLGDGHESPDHPDATVHTCTSGGDRSTLVEFPTPGVATLYAATVAEDMAAHGYQHVVADTWSVWGTDPAVLAAAIDAGGTLQP